MARNLNWFQARYVAKVALRRIRRESWRRWIEFDPANFIWWEFQPFLAGQPGAETPVLDTQETRHPVEFDEFQAAEFFANDWTDEGWDVPSDWNYAGDNGGVSNPVTSGSSGGGTSGGSGGGSTGGTSGGPTMGGGVTPGGTPGTGGSYNPPPDSNGAGPSTGTPGGMSGNKGGGVDPESIPSDSFVIDSFAPPGGGGGGGNIIPPQPAPSPADYTPTVEITLDPGTLDGPSCWIVAPTTPRTVSVSVTMPNPAGGTLTIGFLRVTCGNQSQVFTLAPGASVGASFDIRPEPDGFVMATATIDDRKGNAWTGSDKDQWPAKCLLRQVTWTGTQSIDHRCPDGGSGHNGSVTTDTYQVTGEYAINPRPAGTGLTGEKTATSFPANKRETVVDPYPTGSNTTTPVSQTAPAIITCDVDASRIISNITPAKLGLLYDGPEEVSPADGFGCVETKTGTETGPT